MGYTMSTRGLEFRSNNIPKPAIQWVPGVLSSGLTTDPSKQYSEGHTFSAHCLVEEVFNSLAQSTAKLWVGRIPVVEGVVIAFVFRAVVHPKIQKRTVILSDVIHGVTEIPPCCRQLSRQVTTTFPALFHWSIEWVRVQHISEWKVLLSPINGPWLNSRDNTRDQNPYAIFYLIYCTYSEFCIQGDSSKWYLISNGDVSLLWLVFQQAVIRQVPLSNWYNKQKGTDSAGRVRTWAI